MSSATSPSPLRLTKPSHCHELSFRKALALYAVLFFALIHPFRLFGEVVAYQQAIVLQAYLLTGYLS
jgi:hypothetical protein